MALFESKKKTTKKVAESAVVAAAPARPSLYDVAGVIKAPRITEKAVAQTEKGVYVFEVTKEATKPQIKAAIATLYKVTPAKVRISILPARKVIVRGRIGSQTAIKKAYVYLKKGDKIEVL